MNHLLEVRGELSRIDFKKCWNQTSHIKVFPQTGIPPVLRNTDRLQNHYRANNMYVIQKKRSDDMSIVYLSCRALNGKLSYICLTMEEAALVIEVRSEDPELLDLLYQGVLFISN